MISTFFKKRELRRRQAILKGVYVDNLRILGKWRDTFSRKKPFYVRKSFLAVTISLLAIIAHGNYLSPSLSPEHKTAEEVTVHSFVPEAAQPSSDSSDYRAIISSQEIPLSRIFGLGVKTIMIDPGHGGTDTGTIGKMGTKEKDIVLDIAHRLKTRLEKYGRYNVLMTRESDIKVPLNERVELARYGRADLFISIHLNYLPRKPINIIETYYFGPSSDEQVLELAEQENAGSQYRLSDFREMIEKIGNTLKLQESREFAASIQKNLFLNSKRGNGNVYDFGIKRAPFVVLLGVDVPAVLAEVSCLSNSEEEIQLNTESHRENIARYLEAGILDYLNKGEIRYEAKRQTERG